jgi:hypothetical protein
MQDGAWEWDLVCNVMTCMTAYSDAIFLGKILELTLIKKFCLAKKNCFFTFPSCKVTDIFPMKHCEECHVVSAQILEQILGCLPWLWQLWGGK